jgi:secreted trypsin-like serine protease
VKLRMVALGLAAGAAVSMLATPASAIVGGETASQQYPYEATLLYDHGTGPRMHCGANLIARLGGSSWFETNGHCATQYNPPSAMPLAASALTIALGSIQRSRQVRYPVSRVVVQPWWSWDVTTGPDGQLGDIALIEVPVRVPEQPVRVATTHVGQRLTVIGWGYTSTGPTAALSDTLQQLQVTEIPASNCAGADPGITSGEFCINVPRPGAGPCAGDSGSAALHDGQLVGSASRGVGDDAGTCGTAPGIYTDVAYYLPWIVRTILGSGWTRSDPTAAAAALDVS